MQVSANGKVRRSAEEWQEIFARFARSGLRAAEFCAREGIAKGSFRTWYQRRKPSAPKPAGFLELSPPPGEQRPWEVEVELPGGITVRVRG